VTDQAVEWACLISRHFIPAPPPPVFAPAELRRVAAPVSILLGQYDLFFNTEAIVKRVQQYLSNLTTAEIIPEAGHNLVRERPQLVEEFVLRALAQRQTLEDSNV
jgi:pimeloyl-ACP methyl ester carboxylesterase